MTGEQFLIDKGLMKEGGKILLEPISEKVMTHVNLASLLEDYYITRLNKDLYGIEKALKDSDYEG